MTSKEYIDLFARPNRFLDLRLCLLSEPSNPFGIISASVVSKITALSAHLLLTQEKQPIINFISIQTG